MSVRRVLGNVAGALASRAAGKALSVGFVALLARQTDERTFASYSYLVTLALVFYILTDTGAGLVASREVARGALDLAAAYRSGLTAAAGGAGLGAVAVALFGLLDSGPGSGGLALAFAVAFVPLASIFAFQASLLRCSGRPGLEALLQVASGVLFVAAGGLMVVLGLGLASIMGAFALKELAMVLLAQAFLPRPWRAPREQGRAREIFRRGLVLGAASTCLVLLSRLSLLVLSNVAPVGETARYSAAFRFFEMELMFAETLGFALLPTLGARFADSAARGRRLALRSAALAGGACLVLAAALAAVGPWVLVLVFGERYRAAAQAVQMLAAGVPLLAVFMVAWYALTAARREREALLSSAAGLAAALVASLTLVASPMARTAAWTVLVGYLVAGAVAITALVRQSAPVDLVVSDDPVGVAPVLSVAATPR